MSEQERHPICSWCKHGRPSVMKGLVWCHQGDNVEGSRAIGQYVGALKGVPARTLTHFVNDKGQCDRYAPSLSTRVRQLVRLRPFIPRRGLLPKDYKRLQ